VDARSLSGSTIEGDVALIGAGPAALTIASELVGRGATVVMLDGSPGGRTLPPNDTESECFREDYGEWESMRWLGIGGTAHLWNTRIGLECQAKYVPLDPIDLERREGVRLSGWPMAWETLERYYARALPICGLASGSFHAQDWLGNGEELLPLRPNGFGHGVFQVGAGRIFTETEPERIARDPNVLWCPGASVTRLELDARGKAVSVAHAMSANGSAMRVHAPLFVLAAGGIENARLLLLSLPDGGESGVAYGHMVGRCFMDHPRDYSCVLVPHDPRAFDRLGFYDVHHTAAGVIRGRLALTDIAMRVGGHLSASVSLRRRPLKRTRFDDWGPLSRLQSRVRGAATAGRPADSGPTAPHVEMELHLEQAPQPWNRVVLGARRDAFGLPRAELQWSWNDADRRRLERVRALLVAELTRCGVGRVDVSPEPRLVPSAHHHMGTTRMSRGPEDGVVDRDARVYGLSNLFVAGSSVFPTGGSANPTLTVVALSLRLADHLSGLLRLGIEESNSIRVARVGRSRAPEASVPNTRP